MNTRYAYPADRLSAAWRRLRTPYPAGDAVNYADALQECCLGLGNISERDLDDKARSCVRTIKRTIEAPPEEDTSFPGTWQLRAERLTEKQKHDFSHAVDELAYWFNARLYGID